MNNNYKILIVDDHPIVRQGLAQLLNQEFDFTVCGEAEDATQALESIQNLQPDLVIVDISLKGIDGLELTKKILMQYPELLILVLSMHDEALYAERALRAGAKGYIMKQEGTEKVISAIRKIVNGAIYLSEKMHTRLLQNIIGRPKNKETSILESLSDRELGIFRLIGQGLKTRKIADILNLSIKTIESHREHIKKKLKLKDATELLLHAVQLVQQECSL